MSRASSLVIEIDDSPEVITVSWYFVICMIIDNGTANVSANFNIHTTYITRARTHTHTHTHTHTKNFTFNLR